MTSKQRNISPKRPTRKARALAKPRQNARPHNDAKLSSFDAAKFLDSDDAVAEFIDAALETGEPAVLIRALGEVACAQGMAGVAKRSGLGRESLYKALSEDGNPSLDTILRVARAVGVRFHASAA